MTNTQYDNIPFEGTNYEYKVSLGNVGDKDSLGWASHVYCKRWRDVAKLIDAWQDARDNPVVQVDTAYRPKADHINAE
jgi:hypothetical protein